jgi:hypothetical protein
MHTEHEATRKLLPPDEARDAEKVAVAMLNAATSG